MSAPETRRVVGVEDFRLLDPTVGPVQFLLVTLEPTQGEELCQGGLWLGNPEGWSLENLRIWRKDRAVIAPPKYFVSTEEFEAFAKYHPALQGIIWDWEGIRKTTRLVINLARGSTHS